MLLIASQALSCRETPARIWPAPNKSRGSSRATSYRKLREVIPI
jgi:hypothetical protein